MTRASLLTGSRPASIASVAIIGIVSRVAGYSSDGALVWQRDALAAGEWWRLFSAHAVHLSSTHLLLNLLGLLLLSELLCDELSAAEWSSLLLMCALGISLLLWFLQPQLQWYAGLSGVLYGLWAGAAGLRCVVAKKPIHWLALMALMVRLASGSASIADIPVVAEAHWYGAACGLLWVAMYVSLRSVIQLAMKPPHQKFSVFD